MITTQANLSKTPKYFKRQYTLSPGQEVEETLPVCYGVNISEISPLYGLGFIEFSLDSGNFIPITYMPVYMPFQRIVLKNTHPNATFTLELVYLLEPNAQVLGTFNYVYNQFNIESNITVATNVTFTTSTNVKYGPFYIGTRNQLRAIANFTTNGNVANIVVYNSDVQGNLYEEYSSNVTNNATNDAVVVIDGLLLAPYVVVAVSTVVTSGSVTLNYLLLTVR